MCVGAGVAAASSAFGALTSRPAAASSVGDSAVALAAQEAGDPYVWGAAGPNSFDCSGLVSFVYGKLGISLPHNTTLQYNAMAHVPKTAAQPGDIIFIYDSVGNIYHDGIYAGGGQMWVAPHTGDVVKREAIWTTSYYVGRPGGAPSVTPPPAPSGRPFVAVPVAATAGSTLQLGSVGPVVAALQHTLGLPADGEFGLQTAAAVRAFQSARGLVADGVVGPVTRAALGGAVAAPTVVTVSASVSGVLSVGATGTAVVALQQSLGIAADGDFGPQTLAAVIAFQRGAGLVPDGQVGPMTRAALGRRTA